MKRKHTMKRIIALIAPYKVKCFVLLLLATITVASTLYIPIVIGQGIDLILGPDVVKFQPLWRLLIVLVVIVAITAVVQWVLNLLTNKVTFQIVQDIRVQAFAHLKNLPLAYLDQHPSGDIVSRIATDADQLSDGLFMGFTQFFTGVMTILGTLGFMLSINWKITLLVVGITPISFLMANFVAKRTFTMFKSQSESRGEMTALVEELVGNQKVVQAFSYEDRAECRFDRINLELKEHSIGAVFFSAVSNPATRFVNGLVYTGVGIFGAFMAINGRLSVGQLSAFLNYATQYTKPFNEISGVVTELQNAFACAQRIFDFIDEESERPDDKDAKELWDVNGKVELKDVAFSYSSEVPFISDMNLKAEPGTRIAIVGPTGCGKTTLINLLMRFYEVNGGVIAVDGQDIQKVTKNSLRTSFGMVLQDTWIKEGTIRENIAYGKPDATIEEVVVAAEKAQAHSFIRRMPQGYDTYIEDNGGNLSHGQKQLLCIARVMLREPAMLILDEATSSIDTMTEQRIQKAFEALMQGRTSFIVAHRLSTIRNADMILVMKAGQIIEAGNHQELLTQQGFYAELCDMTC